MTDDRNTDVIDHVFVKSHQRPLPFGVTKHRCGKFVARLWVYGEQEYLGMFATAEQASEVVQQVLARWPDRLVRRRGTIYRRGDGFAAVLKNKRLGSFMTRFHAEKAITNALKTQIDPLPCGFLKG